MSVINAIVRLKPKNNKEKSKKYPSDHNFKGAKMKRSARVKDSGLLSYHYK
ncbi:hypothetical protein PROPEN_02515 [Proteus penneri ATCC 35198]|nr:hypothetical protein PROPEN_02515 [Proteus penneri ATCC 35198]